MKKNVDPLTEARALVKFARDLHGLKRYADVDATLERAAKLAPDDADLAAAVAEVRGLKRDPRTVALRLLNSGWDCTVENSRKRRIKDCEEALRLARVAGDRQLGTAALLALDSAIEDDKHRCAAFQNCPPDRSPEDVIGEQWGFRDASSMPADPLKGVKPLPTPPAPTCPKVLRGV